MGVGERGKEEAPARKSLLVGASCSLLDLAKSDAFKCFIDQKTFPQLCGSQKLAVLERINKGCLRLFDCLFSSLQVFESVHSVGLLGDETGWV